MPYKFLEDIAHSDAAFKAWADTEEELFKAAAEALLKLTVANPDKVAGSKEIAVNLQSESIELLLYDFLQELIFYKDSEALLLKPGKIDIEADNKTYRLAAELSGEKIDKDRHKLGIDIKAVTLHMFEVKKKNKGYEAQVILDV